MIDILKSSVQRLGLVSGVAATLTMAAFLVAGAANAQATDPVDTAFDTLQSKVTTYGGATVALVVAVVVLFFGIKMLRKGAAKA